MKCKYCDTEMVEGLPFCPGCGKLNDPELEAILTEQPEAEEQPEMEAQNDAEQAEETEIKKGAKATPGKIAAAVIAGVLVLAILIGLIVSGMPGKTTDPTQESTEATTEATDASTETTAATVPADGNPDDVTCKGSYSVTDDEVNAAADEVVATMGDYSLTVSQLQVLYWEEVYMFLNNYGSYASYLGLNYTQPLDTQTCQVSDTVTTWQQYFLQSALDSWKSYVAMTMEGKANGFELDEEYQTYLDTLTADMESLATTNGYESADAMMKDYVGPGCDTQDYYDYLSLYYNGYMYYEEVYNNTLPTAEEVEAYFTANEEILSASNVTKDSGIYVDVRHILVSPEGGTYDETTKTTTYSDEEWAACKTEAEKILNTWLYSGDADEYSFGQLANEHSDDGGSNTTGGLYTDVYQGQMVTAFDAWCFDEARQPGDYGLVQTEFGYHVMYFVGSTEIWYAKCESALISETVTTFMEEAMAKYPMEVDYSAIKLGVASLG